MTGNRAIAMYMPGVPMERCVEIFSFIEGLHSKERRSKSENDRKWEILLHGEATPSVMEKEMLGRNGVYLGF